MEFTMASSLVKTKSNNYVSSGVMSVVSWCGYVLE